MITHTDITIRNIPVTLANEIFAVYGHMDADDLVLKYVGCVPLRALTDFTDARSNSLWPSIFLHTGKELHLHVYGIHSTESGARKQQSDLVRTYKPVCNIRGWYLPPHMQSIVCVETGEKWATVKDVCTAHNVAQSALSNHLNGKVGHRTVKGRTYRREV